LSFSEVFSRRATSARAVDAVPMEVPRPIRSLEGLGIDVPRTAAGRSR
jgi:hypothetical protein